MMPGFILLLLLRLLKRLRSPLNHLGFLRAIIRCLNTFIRFPNGYTLTCIHLGTTRAERISHKETKPQRTLLYIHGGAFVMGLNNLYRAFAGQLAAQCDAQVILLDYSLAPEHPFPKALDECIQAYTALWDEHPTQTLIIGGDSAGRNLALSTLLACKDKGIPLPSCVFILSGWFDLTLQYNCAPGSESEDPIINPRHLPAAVASYLRKDVDAHNPYISPIHGNLEGLPPLFLQAGTQEILRDQTILLAQRAQEKGVVTELEVGEGMVHVHPILLPRDPKSQKVLSHLSAFIKRYAP